MEKKMTPTIGFKVEGGNEGTEKNLKLLEWAVWGLLKGSNPSFLANQRPEIPRRMAQGLFAGKNG